MIHAYQRHWDLGITDEEALNLLENANVVLTENNSIESFSVVMVGETTLTDLALKGVLDSLKKLQIGHLKHFKIHLEGLFI